MTELTELSRDLAPRRFSLCEVDRAEDDARVLSWGVAFADVAVLVEDGAAGDGFSFMSFASAGRARRMLARRDKDIRLIWIDPKTP